MDPTIAIISLIISILALGTIIYVVFMLKKGQPSSSDSAWVEDIKGH